MWNLSALSAVILFILILAGMSICPHTCKHFLHGKKNIKTSYYVFHLIFFGVMALLDTQRVLVIYIAIQMLIRDPITTSSCLDLTSGLCEKLASIQIQSWSLSLNHL